MQPAFLHKGVEVDIIPSYVTFESLTGRHDVAPIGAVFLFIYDRVIGFEMGISYGIYRKKLIDIFTCELKIFQVDFQIRKII